MNIVKSSDSEPCGLAVDLMLEMRLEPSRLSHLENLLTESFIRGLSIHTTQYGFSLLSLKLLYRNGLKIWPNKLRSTWMASPKNQKNVLPRISDDIPAWSFLRGDLNLKDPLPFRVIAALTKNTKTQHWPCAAKAAKKNHNPELIPGRIPASRKIGGQTSVTGPYSFWGPPNLRKTQKT